MYEDFLLNNNKEDESLLENQSLTDLDSLFDNLSNDINNFNKYINTINQKNKENIEEELNMENDRKVKIEAFTANSLGYEEEIPKRKKGKHF